jgi:putative colanic acid biosynthesis acetyltransferase WcaF
MTRVRLDRFDPHCGLSRGRPAAVEAAWYLIKCVFFLSPLPWPMGWKRWLLRAFGATLGQGVVIKPRINIHLPWKLTVGDHAWLGEEVFILNFEPVEIGAHACVSQRAFLCTGNHDYADPLFAYRNRPIQIGAGAWVGAQVFVGPGVSVGPEAVVTAGAVALRDMPAAWVCGGNPCEPIRPRWKTGPPSAVPDPDPDTPTRTLARSAS